MHGASTHSRGSPEVVQHDCVVLGVLVKLGPDELRGKAMARGKERLNDACSMQTERPRRHTRQADAPVPAQQHVALQCSSACYLCRHIMCSILSKWCMPVMVPAYLQRLAVKYTILLCLHSDHGLRAQTHTANSCCLSTIINWADCPNDSIGPSQPAVQQLHNAAICKTAGSPAEQRNDSSASLLPQACAVLVRQTAGGLTCCTVLW